MVSIGFGLRLRLDGVLVGRFLLPFEPFAAAALRWWVDRLGQARRGYGGDCGARRDGQCASGSLAKRCSWLYSWLMAWLAAHLLA